MSASSNIVGNFYDKYGTRNPIARWLMRGFLDAVTRFYLLSRAATVLEVGCGEGELIGRLLSTEQPAGRVAACDISLEKLANRNPRVDWCEATIYDLPYADESFDLVICCEVLEHLADPRRGLAEVARVSRSQVLLSTPREPLWRLMNMARGRYLGSLGNTPGHIQHYSRAGLLSLASKSLEIAGVSNPLPWTVLLGRKRTDDRRPVD